MGVHRGGNLTGPAATVVLVLALAFGSTASAQNDVAELEDLKEQREALIEEAAESVENIDVATASVDEVAKALDELTAFVVFHESRLDEAEQALESAKAAVDAADVRYEEVQLESEHLTGEIAEIAVSNFTGEQATDADGVLELAFSDDPGRLARFRHLLTLQTGSLSDTLDRLTALEAEAMALVELQAELAEAAEQAVDQVNARAEVVLEAQERQRALVAAAEIRLESRLAEAAMLATLDEQLATEISDQQAAINTRIARVARENGVEIPKPVDLEHVVRVEFPEDAPDFFIEVHEDLLEATEALFAKAFEDGIELRGYGYRPIQMQIDLRASHCGGTPEDIWHKPVFECSPPTARPGFSKHEHGRAIDFVVNGTTIKSEDSAAFKWLAQHATPLGFENLPGEPWHWSIG